MSEHHHDFSLPPTCPFTITHLCDAEKECSQAWVIHENDIYGQQPKIYAKIRSSSGPDGKREVIVLSDTGCGTEVTIEPEVTNKDASENANVWNIRTFLDFTINPGGKLPYLIILTHCHWSHIMGIAKFLFSPAKTTSSLLGKIHNSPASLQIVASAKGLGFAGPYCKVQENSHCSALGLVAPRYIINT